MIRTLLLTYFFVCISVTYSARAQDEKVVAQVGQYKISLSEFKGKYEQYISKTGMKDNINNREAIINSMIADLLLENFDNNDKTYNNPEYKKEKEWIKKQAILAYLKDQEVYAKIRVTDEETRQAFLRVNEKLAARHLYAATEEEANKLYNLLMAGKDFSSLAKQVFTDTVLQNNGGYVGYFTWGDMDPAFEDAAYNLKTGEISAPVKTSFGYSIIKLEDRVQTPILTESEYEQKKAHLQSVLKIRKKTPYEKEYINRLFNAADVKYNEKALTSILDNLFRGKAIETNKKSSESYCVKYNGKKYSQAEIENKISEIPLYHTSKIKSIEALKIVINGLLLQDKLYGLALAKKYDSAPEVLETINRLSEKTFLEYKKFEILSDSNLPDSILEKYYQENINLFTMPDEMNVQEIILNDKTEADNIRKSILKGQDFGTMAEKKSLREWSAKNKGIMGYADINRYGMIKDTLWNSQLNEIVGPLRINKQYGLFKVLGKKKGKPIDYNSIKNEVAKAAKNDFQKEIVSEYITALSKKTKVKIDKDILASSLNLNEVNNTPR